MLRRALLSIVVVVVSGAAACGGGEDDGRATPPTTPEGGAEAQVSVLPGQRGPTTTAIAARFPFVDFTVTGGVAGLNDHLKVYPDGRAVYDDPSRVVEFRVTAETVSELRSALAQADIASLPPVDGGAPFPDALGYKVIYGGRSVRFHDGTVPPSIRPALEILTREMARGKSGE